jgi:hypothetical protein
VETIGDSVASDIGTFVVVVAPLIETLRTALVGTSFALFDLAPTPLEGGASNKHEGEDSKHDSAQSGRFLPNIEHF